MVAFRVTPPNVNEIRPKLEFVERALIQCDYTLTSSGVVRKTGLAV
jgi:hypothetical protein